MRRIPGGLAVASRALLACGGAGLAMTLVAFALQPAQAQSGGGYAIARQLVAAGSGPASATDWRIDGSVGQAAAGSASGGEFAIRVGYWHGASAGGDAIYANGFE